MEITTMIFNPQVGAFQEAREQNKTTVPGPRLRDEARTIDTCGGEDEMEMGQRKGRRVTVAKMLPGRSQLSCKQHTTALYVHWTSRFRLAWCGCDLDAWSAGVREGSPQSINIKRSTGGPAEVS
ncbi:hypothetical protein ZHAS_00004826 [Anopheles sinensis]|uniref:Uncharacterized protein n=1 Tax=Anopheles sinensis TaxID=74873 RepID=A0A084VHZ2_ANOSI|nr:hypothetical protein ZHAS_00004826 [Anopheles sinensis]